MIGASSASDCFWTACERRSGRWMSVPTCDPLPCGAWKAGQFARYVALLAAASGPGFARAIEAIKSVRPAKSSSRIVDAKITCCSALSCVMTFPLPAVFHSHSGHFPIQSRRNRELKPSFAIGRSLTRLPVNVKWHCRTPHHVRPLPLEPKWADFSICKITAEKSCSAPSSDCLALDRKSTRLNSSHQIISYAVFCLKKKRNPNTNTRNTARHLPYRIGLNVPPTPHRDNNSRHPGTLSRTEDSPPHPHITTAHDNASTLIRLFISTVHRAEHHYKFLTTPQRHRCYLLSSLTIISNSIFEAVFFVFPIPDPSTLSFFFLNDTAPPEIYPFPPQDALPI